MPRLTAIAEDRLFPVVPTHFQVLPGQPSQAAKSGGTSGRGAMQSSFTEFLRLTRICSWLPKPPAGKPRRSFCRIIKVMYIAFRTIRRLLPVALIISVAAAGFRAPMACASGPAVTNVVEHSAPLKCKCGGQGKCCKKGCCAAEPAKPNDQKSQSKGLERRDLGVTHLAALVATEYGPTAFPKPTSAKSSIASGLGTLVAQHTCLQM